MRARNKDVFSMGKWVWTICLTLLVSCENDRPGDGPTSNIQIEPSQIIALGDTQIEQTDQGVELSSSTGQNQVEYHFNLNDELLSENLYSIQFVAELGLANGAEVEINLDNQGSWESLRSFSVEDAISFLARFSEQNFSPSSLVKIRVSATGERATILTPKIVLNSTAVDTFPPGSGDLPDRWLPELGMSWHMQYVGDIEISDRFEIYNIDLFDSSEEFIAELHAAGKKVICYFSAGSYENWRPDSGDFPGQVLGRRLAGWPGERWLDTSRRDLLRPIMEKRIKLARDKGCDGVDPDNVDGYINRTGFSLSYEDTLLYNRMIAELSHKYGLAVGLKNNVDQLDDLVDWYDFAVNESCFNYNECDGYRVFTGAGKPVYQIQYRQTPSDFCLQAQAIGMSSVEKNRNLDAWVNACFEK